MGYLFKTVIHLGSLSYRFIIKNYCFQTTDFPSDCSWTWRKLFKLRSLAKPLVKDVIGDGSPHSLGSLMDYSRHGSPKSLVSLFLPKFLPLFSAVGWTWPFYLK